MDVRLRSILEKLAQEDLDCLMVTSSSNISYLTRYGSRDSYFLISRKKNVYFTDSRYLEEARQALRGIATIKKIDGAIFDLIAHTCIEIKAKRIGFEARHLAYSGHAKMQHALKKGARLIPTTDLVEDLRQIKDSGEIAKMRQAISITIKALQFIKHFIKPGKREIEVAAELERFIRYQGATASAFDIIVAAGPNSSFPHHVTSARKIRENEPVLVDIGVDYQGYKSDLTRVFFLGKIDILAQRVSDIVLTAQRRAIEKIMPGLALKEIDAASRAYITREGFGAFFGHGLGHGLGLQVHEKPHVSGKEAGVLVPGMVFTVEPAIYLPGKFGIRLEDMVVVTKKGCEVLSVSFN